MTRVLFFLTISLAFGHTYGQIRFEPGYILNPEGKEIQCLIKNEDWRNNPVKILYRLSDSDSVRTATTSSIKAFRVYNYSLYVSADVRIDRSPSVLSELTSDKNPKWSQENLFLKVLVDGKATLYGYTNRNLSRFFYSVDSSLIQQLIFKEFVQSQGELGQNNTYKSQLWSAIRCPDANVRDLNSVKYSETDLRKYFKKYNACFGVTESKSDDSSIRNVFNLKLIGGLNSSDLAIRQFNGLFFSKFEFGKVVSPRIGVEGEFIFPFHKNKWGVTFESVYQSYKSEFSKGGATSSIDYSFVELGVGVRHYFFVSDNLRIFLNAHYHPYPRYIFRRNLMLDDYPIKLKQTDLFSVGGGLQYNRFSVDFRYFGKTDITSYYTIIESTYSRTAFTIGYRLIEFYR